MTPGPVPFALVLHANQLMIGDGYPDRDGISATAVGYDAVLTLHEELGVPAALHLSGPLVEALAWHRPDVLARVRTALASGLVRLVGGTYGENIVPLATPGHNRRQLLAMVEIIRDLLGVDAARVPTAWLPERVWRTGPVVSALTDGSLPGGGYRRVLLDDRQLVPVCLDGGSPRAAFDQRGPYGWPVTGWPESGRGLADASVLRTRVTQAGGLEVVPLCSHLRYLVPPVVPQHLALVEDMARDLQPFGERASPPLLVFGDDLERVAGVAGWEPALDRYEAFLRWLVSSPLVQAVHLDDWCDTHPAVTQVALDPGTYFELARLHGAGEDYSAWSDDPRWSPYAARLDRVDNAVQAAVDARPESPLVQVADRLVLLGHHETGWQDPSRGGPGRAPAPWARATAAHAAEALPLLMVDRWFSSPERGLRAQLHDVDEDGEDELVLAGPRLVALLRPRWGARVTLLVRRAAGEEPRMVVGNPADHWNFQEELGRFMDQPAGHPGALGVIGSEHLRFDVTRLEMVGHVLVAVLDEVMVRVAGVALDLERRPVAVVPQGLRLTVALGEESEALAACWTRRGTPGELSVRSAVCPDYRRALAEGRAALRLETGERMAGARFDGPECAEDSRAWVGVPAAAGCVLEPPALGDAGHAVLVTVRAAGRHVDLVVGGGLAGEEVLDRHFAMLHSVAHAERAPQDEASLQLLGVRSGP